MCGEAGFLLTWAVFVLSSLKGWSRLRKVAGKGKKGTKKTKKSFFMKNLQTGLFKLYVSFYSSSLLPSFLCMESCVFTKTSIVFPDKSRGQNTSCWDFLTQSYMEGFFHLPIFLLQGRKWMWIHCTNIQRKIKILWVFYLFPASQHCQQDFYWLSDIDFSSLNAETAFSAELLHELQWQTLSPGSCFQSWL